MWNVTKSWLIIAYPNNKVHWLIIIFCWIGGNYRNRVKVVEVVEHSLKRKYHKVTKTKQMQFCTIAALQVSLQLDSSYIYSLFPQIWTK